MTPILEHAEIIDCGSEAARQAERRKRVHASDAAGVLGVSPWASLTSVYADKTLPAVLVNGSMSERFSIGLELEQPIRAMYVRKFGGKLHAWREWAIAVSRQHPWLGCTPDGFAEDKSRGGLGLLEIKTASEFSRDEWRDSIPVAYQIQVQACLAVTGLEWGVVAVLLGLSSIERYFVERNDAFIAAMLAVLRDFWTCVELRQPPAVDGSAATTRALARLHPDDNGLAINLPDNSDALLAKLRDVKSLAKRCDQQKSAIENELRQALGDNTYGVTPGGEWVSWRSQSRAAHKVAASTFRVLRECKQPKLIEFADDPRPALSMKG